QIPVSFLRSGLLKRTLPAGFLAGIDSILQETRWLVSPSIFTLNTASGDTGANNIDLPRDTIFASPHTGSDLQRDGDFLIDDEGTRWEMRDGIYDFKAPVDANEIPANQQVDTSAE
ncbi:MAG: hypothetical protein AAFQ07_13660, partial [Chloroflexota bacterium]